MEILQLLHAKLFLQCSSDLFLGTLCCIFSYFNLLLNQEHEELWRPAAGAAHREV